jgi:hemin uptake protein HemP
MPDAPDSSPPQDPKPGLAPASGDSVLPVVRSDDLLKGRREILIAHCEEVYRLRLTRNGKLILTK